MTPPVALSIAGSDSGGGAGLQADLRTFTAHGVFGCSVVTVLTAQNTLGVHAIAPVPAAFVAAQLDAVLDDLPVAAVKVGALGSAAIAELIAERAGRLPRLVLDPVVESSSGHRLGVGAIEPVLRERLLRHALVATPNLAEAGHLLGRDVSTLDDAVEAAAELAAAGVPWPVVTGARDRGVAVDVLWHGGRPTLLSAPELAVRNDHGTGCTFAAAVTARLARGEDPDAAVRAAKGYVSRALAVAAPWRLGSGPGPLAWPAADHGESRGFGTPGPTTPGPTTPGPTTPSATTGRTITDQVPTAADGTKEPPP